jgi:N-formylglutamate deformylase
MHLSCGDRNIGRYIIQAIIVSGDLKDMICDEFEKVGYSTTVNNPFAGTIVPLAYYQRDTSVMSIMVEVNRKLYMDESTGLKNSGIDSVKRHISSILNKIRMILSR